MVMYLFYELSVKSRKKSLVYAPYASEENLEKMFDKVPIIFAIIIFGYFIYIIGMRGYIFDTGVYIDMFKGISTDFSTAMQNVENDSIGAKSYGFYFIVAFIKCFITQDWQMYLMIVAIFTGVCVAYTFYKHSINFFYSSFLFIAFGTVIWSMNGIRQFIVVVALFALSDWIKRGKFIPFCIAVLILSTIHTSCFMMIPLYFVARCKPWSGRIVGFLGVIIILAIFLEPLLDGVGSDYANLVAEDTGVNPMRVAFFALPVVFAFMFRNTLQKEADKDIYVSICINMSLATAALYFVGMFTSGIFIGRLPVYCELYECMLVPFLMKKCFNDKNRKLAYIIYTGICLYWFYVSFAGLPYGSTTLGTFY